MPVPLLALGVAGVQAGISGFNAWRGNKQKNAAKAEMESLNKPSYSIPQELLDNLSDAEKRTVEGLPAAQKQQWVQNLERSRQTSLKASADRKGGLAGLQESTNLANDQYTNLLSLDATALEANKQRKEAAVERARANVAGARERKFGHDNADYQAQLQSAQANYQAGARNQNAGINNVAGSLIGLAGSGALGSAGGGSGASSVSAPSASSNFTSNDSLGGLNINSSMVNQDSNTLLTGGNQQQPGWGGSGSSGFSTGSNFTF